MGVLRSGDSAKTMELGAPQESGMDWLEGELDLEFQPVTTRRVRLNISKATEVITIWEFPLFQQ